jgi:hypothetical protein
MLQACLTLSLLGAACKAVHLLPLHCSTSQTWAQLRPASGDLLLFSLAGLKDDLLKFCFHCPITHVGLLVLDASQRPFVWETTQKGCRIVPLQHYQRQAATVAIVYRQLEGPRSAHFAVRLERFIRQCQHVPYGHDYWRPLHNRLFPHLRLSTPMHRTVRFCTDLVAETLAHMGVLDFRPSLDTSADILPVDFTQGAERLPLVHGYRFGEEIKIVC